MIPVAAQRRHKLSYLSIVETVAGASNSVLGAARTLAENSPALKDSSASLLPPLAEIRRVAAEIAAAVGVVAQKEGVAPKLSQDELRQRVLTAQWVPAYPPLAAAAK